MWSVDASSARCAEGSDSPIEGRVEALIVRAGDAAAVDDGALHRYLIGGKRLRARLVIAAGSAGGRADHEALARYGAFVELIHAGGLCHDDVVDRSPWRRSGPSLAHSHGRRTASLLGVHLMLRAYVLVADAPSGIRAAIAHAAACAASGQADEMSDLYRLDVTPDEYLARSRAKTATLFELAATLGADAAQVDPETRAAVVAFGADLGTAYQLADDLRDLTGDAVVGRRPGTDLREGAYPLPVLLTMNGRYEGAERLRVLLDRLRRAPDPAASIDDVRTLLSANGSIAGSLQLVTRLVRGARSRTAGLPAEARRRLERLLEQAIPATVWRSMGAP